MRKRKLHVGDAYRHIQPAKKLPCTTCHFLVFLLLAFMLATCVLFGICLASGLLRWRGDATDMSIYHNQDYNEDLEKERRDNSLTLLAFRICFVLLIELVVLGLLASLNFLFNPAHKLTRLGLLCVALFALLLLFVQVTSILILLCFASIFFTYTRPPMLGLLVLMHVGYVVGMLVLSLSYETSVFACVYASFAVLPSLLMVFKGLRTVTLHLAIIKTLLAAIMVCVCAAVFLVDQIEVVWYVQPCFPPALEYKTPLDHLIAFIEDESAISSIPPVAEEPEELDLGDVVPEVYVAPKFDFDFQQSKNLGLFDLSIPTEAYEEGDFTTAQCHARCAGYTFAIAGANDSFCTCTHLPPIYYTSVGGEKGWFWSLLSPCWFARPQLHFLAKVHQKDVVLCGDTTVCSPDAQPCCTASFVARCPLDGIKTQLCLDEICRQFCDAVGPQFCAYDLDLTCPRGFVKETWAHRAGWREETLRWAPLNEAFEQCQVTKECCGVQGPDAWHMRQRGRLRMLPCRNFKGTLCRKGFLEYFITHASTTCDDSGLNQEWKGFFKYTFEDYRSFQNVVTLSLEPDEAGYFVIERVRGSMWEARLLPNDRVVALVPRAADDQQKGTGVEYGWSWEVHILRPNLPETRDACYELCASSATCSYFHFARLAHTMNEIELEWTISDSYFQPLEASAWDYTWYQDLHQKGVLKAHTEWLRSTSRAILGPNRVTIMKVEGVEANATGIDALFKSIVKPFDPNSTVSGVEPKYTITLRLKWTLQPREMTVCRTFSQCDSVREAFESDNLEELQTFIVDKRGWITNEDGATGITSSATCPAMDNATRPSATYLTKSDCFAQCEAANCITAAYAEIRRTYRVLEGACVDNIDGLDVKTLYVRDTTRVGTRVLPHAAMWAHGDDAQGGEGTIVSLDGVRALATVRWDRANGTRLSGYSIGNEVYELLISSTIRLWEDGNIASPYVVPNFDLCRVQCDAHAMCVGFQAQHRSGVLSCTFLRRGATQVQPSAGSFCYGAHVDPFCSSGILSGSICCHGACGGFCSAQRQCALASVGKFNCCHGLIRSSNRVCTESLPPCIIGYGEGMSRVDFMAPPPLPTGPPPFLAAYDPNFGAMCRGNRCKCYFIYTFPPQYCLVGYKETLGPSLPPEFSLWSAPIGFDMLVSKKECRHGDVIRRSQNGWNSLDVPSSIKLGDFSTQVCANQVLARGLSAFSWHNGECYLEWSSTRTCLPKTGVSEFAYGNTSIYGPINVGDFVTAFVDDAWWGGMVKAVFASSILFKADEERNAPTDIAAVGFHNLRTPMDPSGWRDSEFSFYEIPKPTNAERRTWDGVWSRAPPSFDCCFACSVQKYGPLLFSQVFPEVLLPLTLSKSEIGLYVQRDAGDCADIFRSVTRLGLSMAAYVEEGCGLVGRVAHLGWALGIVWVDWEFNNSTLTKIYRVGTAGPKTDLQYSGAEQDCKDSCASNDQATTCAYRPRERACFAYTMCDTKGAPGLMTPGSYIVWRRGVPVNKNDTQTVAKVSRAEYIGCVGCAPQLTPVPKKKIEVPETPVLFTLMVFGPIVAGGCGYVLAAQWWIFLFVLHLAFLNALRDLSVEDKSEVREAAISSWTRTQMNQKIAPSTPAQLVVY